MRKSKRDNNFSEDGFEFWGGYMNAKIAKLEEQFLEQAEKEENKSSNLFSGISIFVNGYTKPSSAELKLLMAEHGGVYHHYFKANRTKFIIASNLPDTKVRNLPTTKIVKPEWISESLKAGILLDHKNFLLYSNHSKTQPRLKFLNADTTSETIKSSANPSMLVKSIPPGESSENEEGLEKDITHNVSNTGIENHIENGNVKKRTECMPMLTHNELLPNRITMSPERNNGASTRTAVDPRFLSEFYNNSRLHHISQLGAGFKQYVNELRNSSDHNFPLRESLKFTFNKKTVPKFTNHNKIIMHIDMDCFFVSVGLRKHPNLRGQPVAVTHAKSGGPRQHKREGVDRKSEFNLYKTKRKNTMKQKFGGALEELENEYEDIEFTSRVDGITDEDDKFGSMSEIASCSYEARALGLYNGMFMGAALRLCPDLKTIPYDFDAYKEVAYLLYDTVAQYTLDIEAVSCDEMYVDCSDVLNDVRLSPMEFAKIIRDEIKEKTDCPCSTGFGSNRLQARLATKKAKPDGQFHLQKEDVKSFFADISLGDLPGVGRQMEYKLTALGFTNCASLRSTDLSVLQKHFGNKTGRLLYNYCRGHDDKSLNFTIIRKSISAGVNYGIRFEDFPQCETFLNQLCQEVCSRMSQNKVLGKAITFKLMVRAADAPVETAKFMGHGFCDNVTKTTNLKQATNNIDVITKEVINICKKLDVKPEEMRGVSIQISKLESAEDKVEEKRGGIQYFLRSTKELPNNVPKVTSISSLIDNKNIKETNNLIKTSIDEENGPVCDFKELNKSILICDLQNQESHLNQNNSINVISTISIKDKTDIITPHNNKINQGLEKKSRSLGLTGKRRGRPPKNASLACNNNHIKESNKIKKLFVTSNYNSPSTEVNKYNFEDLDQDFLNALPDDIKSEILANCKKRKTEKKNEVKDVSDKCESKPKIDPDYLSALPEEIRKEIESNLIGFSDSHIKNDTPTFKTTVPDCPLKNSDNILILTREETSVVAKSDPVEDILHLYWKDVRAMLRDWLKSTKSPMQCDVDMIVAYVKNLVIQRQIENLDCLLKFFYRTMRDESSCNWHQVYLQVEANVQEAMLLVYRKKLKTTTIFPCCNR